MTPQPNSVETIRQIRLGADRRSPHRARAFVRETLDYWGRPELVADVTLAVSELVANAVIHADSSAELTLLSLQDGVQIRVHDSNPNRPEVRWVTEDATGGRGLRIVDALSDDWGIENAPPGKIVWLDIRNHG